MRRAIVARGHRGAATFGDNSTRTDEADGGPDRQFVAVFAEIDGLYVGKLLYVNAGESLSLQLHHEKTSGGGPCVRAVSS
ncbi:hypothetical protein EAH86_08700 [Pedococcus bigeumensis]|uniref:Uncharacterized protein n=1 Tax=Pedococcus bigeumensis TaxID=433644 RepID=A0A502CTB1_9MICO|nr:hypothetical protein EAH86_08700 [Pedococcus bigeumensis]